MNESKEIYLLGVGGMGMAPLASYLFEMGFRVFGWDDYASEERRKQLNCVIWTEQIPATCSVCVRSTAIDDAHPIYKTALEHCHCYLRGEFVAELLHETKLCVICGSHGKSTTTAYLIHFFQHYNIPVNYLLGAEFQNNCYASASYHKEAEWTLLELDESDGTIDLFSPEVSVILNTDWDHPLHYKTPEDYHQAFKALGKRTKRFVLTNEDICQDSINGRRIEKTCDGLRQNAVFARKAFELLTQQKVDDEAIKTFPGIRRRQEILFKTKRLTILSDYAHHPGELKALLSHFDVNDSFYLVFEPHRISRLNQFFNDFVEALKPVKHLYLCPTYEAFEGNKIVCKQLNEALTQAHPFEQLNVGDFVSSKQEKTIVFAGAGYMEQHAKGWTEQLEKKIYDVGKEADLEIQWHKDLKTASLMKTGGKALGFCNPKNLEVLKQVVSFCDKIGLDIFTIGSGSNVLIPDEEYRGIVIKFEDSNWKYCKKRQDCTYEVGAGIILSQFLNLMESQGVGCFEFLDGIPGTLGGALSMNAGTRGIGILDRVLSVEWMDFSGEIHTTRRENLQYSYRCCETLSHSIILSAVLQGEPSTIEKVKEQRNVLREKRHLTQPGGANLGCFFKNTALGSTGKLINQAGLKNMHFGDIFVSPIHANFIVNKGSGTYQDVLKLVHLIRNKVKEKTGVILEPEVRLLGESWEQVL